MRNIRFLKKINLTSNNFEKKNFGISKSAQEIYKKTSEKDEDPMTRVFRVGMDSLNEHKNRSARV